MKSKAQMKQAGRILTGTSLLLLFIMNTGIHSTLFFLCGILLFVLGISMSILSDLSHHYEKNFLPALLITAFVFVADIFLKWAMLEEQTLANLTSTIHNVLHVYPLQSVPDPQYRTLLPEILLFLSLLFRNKDNSEQSLSFISALFQMIGDNAPLFLTAQILVSTFPAYWNGGGILILLPGFDIAMGVVLVSLFHAFRKDKDAVNESLWNTCAHFVTKKKNILHLLYYVAFACQYFYHFFNTSMFPTWLQDAHPFALKLLEILNQPMLLLAVLLAFAAVFEADQKHEKIIIATCLILGFIFYGSSENGAVLSLLMFTAGAVHKDARKILWIAFIEGLAVLIPAFAFAKAGIIQDLYYWSKHAMGMIYTTDCLAHWFYIFAIYCLLRKGKFHWYEYIITFAIFLYLYWQTGAETNLICFLLVWIAMLIHQCFSKKKKEKPSSFSSIFIWSYVICAAAFFIAVKYTDQLVPYLQVHFGSLLARLMISTQALSTYPVRFLFRAIEEHGNGFMDINSPYFYLDVSYIRILLIDGILVFTYIMTICTWFLHYARKKRWTMLFIILAVIAIQSMVEQRLPEYWYNVFIILPLADFALCFLKE